MYTLGQWQAMRRVDNFQFVGVSFTRGFYVAHPRWRVYDVQESKLECDVANLYGAQFVDCLKQSPTSAFLAEGSPTGLRIVEMVNTSAPHQPIPLVHTSF